MDDKFISAYFDYFDKIFEQKLNKVHRNVEKKISLSLNEKSIINFRNNELSYLTGALTYPDKNTGTWFNRGILRHYFGSLVV